MKIATLTITCEYAPDTPDVVITDLLRQVARMAAGRGLLTGDGEIELDTWGCDVKITDDSPSGPRVIAHFQPQAWVDDNAIDIDGAYEFDVTKQIEQMGREAAEKIRDGDYSSDDLWHVHCDQHPGDHHDGPFIVTVEEAIETYFEAKDANDA